MIDYRIISIGCLGANPLWGERAPVRTGHATTILIRSGDRRILVDPGLPSQALEARLHERTGLRPGAITDVFLTSFHPDARRGIRLFDHASWWIGETEREAVGVPLASQLARLAEEPGTDPAVRSMLEQDVAVLQKCMSAPDTLAERVSLFPLPGASPGLCGLLLEHARYTVLATGDAVPTIEHLERGMVIDHAFDIAKAKESFAEVMEIADLIIPGRDNIAPNPTRRAF